MTISTLNYTGRRKLKHPDTRIYLSGDANGRFGFDAELNLASYGLPNDAYVHVEAYRQTSWMRFDFGTVGHIVVPEDRLLTAFDSGEAILFRVKVTSGSARHGVLLAEGDRIRPSLLQEEERNRIPLLPVIPDSGLGQQIFRVSYEDDRAVLCINNQQLDWRSLARSQIFVSLVYPEVLRTVLVRILRIEKYTDTDTEDSEDWRSQWLQFACLLPGVGDVPSLEDEEGMDDWIESVVTTFARSHGMLDKFMKRWNEESGHAT